MKFLMALIATCLVVYVLVIGKEILLPFVVALFIWYLINAFSDSLRLLFPRHGKLRLVVAVTLGLGIFWVPVQLVVNSLPDVVKAAPGYQANIQRLLDSSFQHFNIEPSSLFKQVSSSLSLSDIISKTASGITSLTGNALLILVYLLFLFMEQSTFSRKLSNMFRDKQREASLRQSMQEIYVRVRSYLWVKTQMSLLTALLSYSVMFAIDLDFAAFWALLIFFFNFIPNIGSVLATAFPALLALVQFDTLTPFIITVSVIGGIQFLVGNVLEPRAMGQSLNLSPLVILLALVFWANVWGLIGMFLSVPITVILLILCAQFPATRSVAVLLSQYGNVGNGQSSEKTLEQDAQSG